MAKTAKSGWIRVPLSWFVVLGVVLAIYLNNQMDWTHFKLSWVYPYALMWTGFREANSAAWLRLAPVDRSIIYPPMPVPEIAATDYSFDSLKRATRGFRLPAVVRGFFNDTTAVQRWASPDYLPSKLGDFIIPVVRNGVVGSMQDDRKLFKFNEAFAHVQASNYAKEYIFFPVKSRFTFNHSREGASRDLEKVTNALCHDDLDLERLWPGFGTPRHRTFVACQVIIGKSTVEVTNRSIGTDWHCAGGNNWFVQVAGSKYWEFIEPQYSPYLAPLKGGAMNMWTSNKNMAIDQQHVPRWHATLRAGDLLYNPDWMWHKIINKGAGLSIGVPVREANISLPFQNNFYFSTIMLTNKLLSFVVGQDGLALPGYPPPSPATEQDN